VWAAVEQSNPSTCKTRAQAIDEKYFSVVVVAGVLLVLRFAEGLFFVDMGETTTDWALEVEHCRESKHRYDLNWLQMWRQICQIHSARNYVEN